MEAKIRAEVAQISELVEITRTAEAAETAEKSFEIPADLCVLCG